MSDSKTSGPLSARLKALIASLTGRPHEEDTERRRDVLWLLLLLFLFLIPAVLCRSQIVGFLQGATVAPATPDLPVTEILPIEEAASLVSNEADVAPVGLPQYDGQACSVTCLSPQELNDELSISATGGTQTDAICGTLCTFFFGTCLSGEQGCQNQSVVIPDGYCSPEVPCDYESGLCWADTICTHAQPPPPIPDDDSVVSVGVCDLHEGVQWEGDVCVCAGVIDQVTICQDSTKFDNLTDTPCTPDSAACSSSGSGGGPDVPTQCGNGIVEVGEACDGSDGPCGGGGWYCTDSCTCDYFG